MVKFAFLWLIILAVLVTLIVYGVRAILHRRQDWALANSEWEVDVIPGKNQTDIMLQEVARVGSKCKVLRSTLHKSVNRNDPHHDIEVMIAKDDATEYIKNALT